jgi:hypothetical protein
MNKIPPNTPNCFGHGHGCLEPHCTCASGCYEFDDWVDRRHRKKEQDDLDHEAEVHDMMMANLGDERYM